VKDRPLLDHLNILRTQVMEFGGKTIIELISRSLLQQFFPAVVERCIASATKFICMQALEYYWVNVPRCPV
jgi:hypothetical protein